MGIAPTFQGWGKAARAAALPMLLFHGLAGCAGMATRKAPAMPEFIAPTSVSFEHEASGVHRDLVRVEGERPGFQRLVEHSLASGEAFLFFRSFVAYYYELARRQDVLADMPPELRSASGWCAGDAHLGNFGTVIDIFGQPRLTIVDFDDAGFCPLILDALRFWVSLYLLDPSLADDRFDATMDSYRSVLAGAPARWSEAAQAKLAASARHGMRFSSKAADGGKLRLQDRDDRHILTVSATTRQEITKALRARLGSASELLDVRAIDKTLGGSAGRQRYRVLFMPEIRAPLPQGAKRPALRAAATSPWIFDLKEIAPPATRFALQGELWPPAEAATRSLNIVVGGSAPYYGVVSLSGKDFTLRPRWLGNEAWDAQDSDALLLAGDAAQALAIWHLEGANLPASYTQALARVSNAALRRWAQTLAHRIEADYSELRRLYAAKNPLAE